MEENIEKIYDNKGGAMEIVIERITQGHTTIYKLTNIYMFKNATKPITDAAYIGTDEIETMYKDLQERRNREHLSD